MQHLQPNTTLQGGKYRIERVLGQGGFGNTYEGVNTVFNERVAIKEFFMRGITLREDDQMNVSISVPENRESFMEQKEKFKKEALRIRQLTNEHIVAVHDFFEENGTAYYVMDYIDGENLAERLKRTGRPMPESEVRLILPQILDALQAVHDAGIWHLDLKPANIMLDNYGHVKLIDFGASKQLNSQKGGATTSSAITYTNGYAPREQMEQNYDKFGPWTDIYALGATLYNLLTNRRPPLPTDIDDDNSEDKHQAMPFPPAVSEYMKKLVLQLMHTNRTQRPQLINDIHNIIENTSVNVDKGFSGGEETIVLNIEEKTMPPKENDTSVNNESLIVKKTKGPNKGIWIGLFISILLLLFVLLAVYLSSSSNTLSSTDIDSINADSLTQIVEEDTKQKMYVSLSSLGNFNYVYSGSFIDNSGIYPVKLSFKCIDGIIKECIYHNVRLNKDIKMTAKEEEQGINFYARDGKDSFIINLFSDNAPSKLYGKTFIGEKTMEVKLDLATQTDLTDDAKNEEDIENMKNSYKQLLKDFSKVDEDENCYYFLYDITENGMPELCVVAGTCEADEMLYIYTYKDRLRKIFETGAGHSYFYTGKNYILQWVAHMGSALWIKIYFSQGEIHKKEIYSESVADVNYKEPKEQFAGQYRLNNLLPINSIK